MPEFEHKEPTRDPSHHYEPSQNKTPAPDPRATQDEPRESVDAAAPKEKPRSRRRSSGFQKPAAQTTAKIGEVDPEEAAEELAAQSDKPARSTRSEPEAEAKTPSGETPKPVRSARPKPSAQPSAVERDTRAASDPQPSEATLAAIEAVEARIAARRSERETRKQERGAKRPPEAKPRPDARGATAKQAGGRPKPKATGFVAKLAAFFKGLFGAQPEPPKPAPSDSRKGSSGQRSQGPNRRRPQGGGGPRNANRGNRSGNRRSQGNGRRSGNRPAHKR